MLINEETSSEENKWKLSQIFGENRNSRQIIKKEIITVVSFDKTGDYLAIGDTAGRVIIFERQFFENKSKGPKFIFLTEFQSHEKEFDTVRSESVKENVIQIQWLFPQNNFLCLLVSNAKTIKFWKIINKTVKTPKSTFKKRALNFEQTKSSFPLIKISDQGHVSIVEQLYSPLHSFSIHSLSKSCNGENFLSADEFRINLWNLEANTVTYNLFDAKPEKLDDLAEVITRAKFSPLDENNFCFSTSSGSIFLGDFRVSPKPKNCVKFSDSACKLNNPKLYEILDHVSDIAFSSSKAALFSRDANTVKLWDFRQTTSSLNSVYLSEKNKIHPNDLFDFDCLNDQFSLSVSPNSDEVLTGNYNAAFHILENLSGKAFNETYQLDLKEVDFKVRQDSEVSEQENSQLSVSNGPHCSYFKLKVLRSDWNPVYNCIAVAMDDSFYIYNYLQ